MARKPLRDVSRHCTFPATAPQQRTSRPSRKRMQSPGPGDNQKGMTEMIAARGTVTRGLHRSAFGATMIATAAASHPEILESSADAIVSPANSFGYMDGGIDLVYLHRFGWELQTALWPNAPRLGQRQRPVAHGSRLFSISSRGGSRRLPLGLASSTSFCVACKRGCRHQNNGRLPPKRAGAPNASPTTRR